MPKDAQYCDNNLYGAIDIYLKVWKNFCSQWSLHYLKIELLRPAIKLGFTFTKDHYNNIFMFFIEFIKA